MGIAPDQTLLQWLRHHAETRPQATAIEASDETLTYCDVHTRVTRLASGLAGLGIGRGDVVGVQLPNIAEFVIAFLAVTARGGIFQTLHMPYRAKELSGLLADASAKAVIVTHGEKESRARDVLRLRGDLSALDHIVVLGPPLEGCEDFAALMQTDADPENLHDADAADDYLLLYTSGTTAKPKGVPHTYANFLNNALASAQEMQIGSEARVLSLAPMTHLYGLFTVHMALSAGACQVLLPAFNPNSLLDDLAKASASHIYAAPAHFAGLVASGGLSGDTLRDASLICLSGSAVPPALARVVDDAMPNGSVVQLWGMSELQAGCFGRPGDPEDTRMRTSGRASPKTELRVLGEDRTPLPADTEGALEMRGPSLFKGYLNRPDETAKAFDTDGWFATGDLAVIDVEGFVTITGRTKELINRGGVKYNPLEVEEIVLSMSGVTGCAQIPLADVRLGERACLCVTLAPDAVLTLDDVTARLDAAGMAKYKWPERLEVMAALPMTPTRKVIRGALAAQINEKDNT